MRRRDRAPRDPGSRGAAYGPAALERALEPWADVSSLWVAYSGGVDSHALLHAAVRLGRPLRAVHVDHGIHPRSADWAEHCRQVCRDLGVPLAVERVRVDPRTGEGLEAAARTARYRVFESVLNDGGYLAMAHHADDQLETVLLRVLRGSGVAGLGGMPPERALGAGRLIRPLLGFTREALLAYAAEQGLRWVEDPSNQDPGHDRNYLRHRVVPLLRSRWPELPVRLDRLARHARDADSLLREYARGDIERLGGGRLAVGGLAALSGERAVTVFREWIRRSGRRPPPEIRLRQGLRDLLEARVDASPRLAWEEGQVRRYGGRLHLLPARLPAPPGPVRWDGAMPLHLEGLGTLRLERGGPGLVAAVFEAGVTVAFRRGGESLRMGAGRRPLKKLLQERGVPPWDRELLPLLFRRDELIAVPGLAMAADRVTDRDGVRVIWEPEWEAGGSGP